MRVVSDRGQTAIPSALLVHEFACTVVLEWPRHMRQTSTWCSSSSPPSLPHPHQHHCCPPSPGQTINSIHQSIIPPSRCNSSIIASYSHFPHHIPLFPIIELQGLAAMSENGGVEDPLAGRLAKCRPFLREDYEAIDPRLPGLLKILNARGAGECWHKHGTFAEHLLHTYRILKLWGCSDTIALVALTHSSYSNSYVNLAIFAPDVDRSVLRDLIGEESEELVHLFCIVPRQELIFDRLLHRLTDDELLAGLKQWDHEPTNDSLKKKKKLFVPKEGMVVKHIRTGEDVVLPRRVVALFLLLTMADFADQFYGWQDILFGNEDGEFRYKGNGWHALWPGTCKPGLWLTIVSRMGVLLNILLHEDAAEQEQEQGEELHHHRFKDLKIPLPELFNKCTQILSPLNQSRSRDQYWEAMHIEARDRLVSTAMPLLKSACELNPFVAEPHLLLAHIHLTEGEYEMAESEASEGVKLLLDWATTWDKRMTWEGWLSFARVMRDNAHQKTWPRSAFGIINLGLVK